MNIQHLIYAIEVHNCGSISKAAQNLYVAQPNLRSAIKELEEEVGIVIFNRSCRGIKTTKDGLELLKRADEIISRLNALEKLYSKQDIHTVRLSITTMRSSIICEKLARYINYMNEKDISLKVHFKEATNFDAINDVVNGQADIGIIRANGNNFCYFKLCFSVFFKPIYHSYNSMPSITIISLNPI
jgi:DNA-binding transcriptional LysR family regulator